MTRLPNFPPDVIALAVAAIARADAKAERIGEPTDTVDCIADAIMADRAARAGLSAAKSLTARQADCLRFIAAHQSENAGVTPSYDEIKDGLGLASKSGVNRLIDGLVERGAIKRLPNRARAITIIANPN